MSSFLTHMTWWHWMIFAVALAAAETLLPGAVAICTPHRFWAAQRLTMYC